MPVLSSRLIIELIDRFTAPSKVITARMNALHAAAGKNAARMDAMRGRMVAAGVGAYGLARAMASPVTAAKDFETVLEDIGQKAAMSGMPLDELGKKIQALAKATNQMPSATANTFNELIGFGLGGKDDAENVDAALKMMPAINKVATAYRAAALDVAKAGQAAFSNLKVPAEQMMRAFDAMAKSGKEGAFELKDMARYFPSLTTAAAAAGIKGVKGVADLAAALQAVRQGAGDSSEAATNLQNVLQKIDAPVTQTNFEKVGIDFRAEMAKAAKKGASPIEAAVAITKRAMKKKGTTLGDLFADREAKMGMLALIEGLERYKKIRTEALKASGSVEEDYARRIQTFDAALERLKGTAEDTNQSIGKGLTPGLTYLMDEVLNPILTRIGDFAKANPKLTSTIIGLTGGLIGLRIAGIAAKWAFSWLKGGVLATAIGALRIFGPLVTGLGVALGGLGALVSAPFIAIGLAVAGAALLIYKYWTPIKEYVSGFASVVGNALGEIASAVGAWAKNKLIDFAEWLGFDRATISAEFDRALVDIKASFTVITDWIKNLFTQNEYSDEATKGFRTAGEQAGQAMVDAIKLRMGQLIEWFKGLPGRLLAAFGSLDFGKAIKMPVGPGAKSPFVGNSISGARASGGPVRRGGTYLVGENGPELATFGASGVIHNTNKTVAALKAAAIAASGVGSGTGSGGKDRGGVNNSFGGITITVHGTEGQSAKEIAGEVKRIFSQEMNALSRGSFSDGVYA